jgi:hypothetical protein
MRRALPALWLVLLTAGCISTSVERLDQAPQPARAVDSVTVLAQAPDRPYTVLAVVTARGATVFDSFDDLRARVVADAAALGGHAVILAPGTTTWTPIFNTVGFVRSEERRLVGEVIVF